MRIFLSIVILLGAAMANAETNFNVTCISGRSTLKIVTSDPQTAEAIIYLQIFSFDAIDANFIGTTIEGGRFIKVSIKNSSGFVLFDTQTNEADLVWGGLTKETTPGHRRFRCYKK